MGACAEHGIGLCFLTQHGHFLARVSGPVHGNILLRNVQYRTASAETSAVPAARLFLLGTSFGTMYAITVRVI